MRTGTGKGKMRLSKHRSSHHPQHSKPLFVERQRASCDMMWVASVMYPTLPLRGRVLEPTPPTDGFAGDGDGAKPGAGCASEPAPRAT